MGQVITILKLVVMLLPIMIQTIAAIEEAVPGQGAGEAKLAAVRVILQGAYETANNVQVSFDALWPALQKAISGLVTAFNATTWPAAK